MSLEVVSPTEALLDGRYVLKERVGRGGMATVYRAEDIHLERVVAIKMIHEDEGAAASAERAHNEKALLAAVDHRSLVTLYDAQLAPGRPRYLVMEFIEGPTLARRMSNGPMRPRQVARVARDIAEALVVVHDAGIVHRDIKPSNILLARTPGGGPWTAKLADFGIACTVGSPRLTSPGIVLGTLTYMAPEQLRDLDPGISVDIFSLGLMLLEALTGHPGYVQRGTGRDAAIARVMNPPSIPDSVTGGWRELLDRMTRLDPEERPTAREVARAARILMRKEVAEAVSPEAGEDAAKREVATTTPTDETSVLAAPATPDRPAMRQRPGARRRRAAAGAAAAAALVITGAFVTGLATANPPVDGWRLASSIAERAAIVPADDAVAETGVTEPTTIEPVVVDQPASSDDSGPSNDKGKSNENKGPGNNNGNGGKSKG